MTGAPPNSCLHGYNRQLPALLHPLHGSSSQQFTGNPGVRCPASRYAPVSFSTQQTQEPLLRPSARPFFPSRCPGRLMGNEAESIPSHHVVSSLLSKFSFQIINQVHSRTPVIWPRLTSLKLARGDRCIFYPVAGDCPIATRVETRWVAHLKS